MRLHRSFLTSLLAIPLSFIVPKSVTAQASPSPGNIDKYAGNYLYRTDDIYATGASLRAPDGLAMDLAGNLYIADKSDHAVRKVSPSGQITTVIGTLGSAGFSPDGVAATSAQLNEPISVAVNADGTVLYVADYANHVVRKVDASGNIITVAGNGAPAAESGDVIPEVGSALATSLDPHSVALNPKTGELYVADLTHCLVRKVDASGNITTVAGSLYAQNYDSLMEGDLASKVHLYSPKALAFDKDGNLYIADQYAERVYKVDTTTKTIRTFAGTGMAATDHTAANGDGGLATLAQLNAPAGLTTDAAGNLYITDQGNFRIRKVDVTDPKNEVITTIAGNGVAVSLGTDGGPVDPRLGDGGLAINASLHTYVAGLVVSSSNYLYIADFGNTVVRVVNLATPACSFTLSNTSAAFSAAAADGSVNVTSRSGCSWTATSSASWLTVTPASSAGNGSVSFHVEANSSTSPRSGTFTVEGQTFTITQQGTIPACSYTLSESSAVFSAAPADGSVNVTSQSGCSWTATSGDSWLTVMNGANGVANGSVSFHAQANIGNSPRTATITIAGQDMTVTQAGTAVSVPSGLRFVPVTPCRIADTRDANGSFGGPVLAGQTTRDFPVPQSRCGIPADAQAYSMNFTVVPTGKLDYLTVFPTGQPKPFVSTLNSRDGRIKANAAIVPASKDGAVSVFATDSTQVIIDINGYFVPASNTSALAFYPMAPCRVTDTRIAAGAFGMPAMAGQQERIFPVQTSSCQVPASAKAYSLNYTVVPKKPLGYLTTWPTGKDRPLVSTLNAPTGTITANAAIVPAGDNGDVSVFVTDDTELIVDINGYFAPPANGGLSLYNLEPCRVYDSREVSGGQPMVNTTAISVAGTCKAPANAQSYVFNSTVVPTNSLLFLSLWPHGTGDQPTVSALNAPDGAVTSNMALVPTSDGSINAFGSDSTHMILDIFGYFAP